MGKIKNYKWHRQSMGYAMTGRSTDSILLHHIILPKMKGLDVDHINRDKLDNRRENLRYLTHQENAFNNGARGYFWSDIKKRWIASIKINYKHIPLGSFKAEEDAKNARRNAVNKYFKEVSTVL